ncbi:hypothetical protein MTP99_016550 [Tenebrio molitor]|nr:hypothetical protein MTP99_016550 [Tenebrio molitor]
MRGKRSIRPSVDLDNCQERYRILSDPKDKCVLATLEHHQGPNSITALTNPLKIVATIAPYFGGAISTSICHTCEVRRSGLPEHGRGSTHHFALQFSLSTPEMQELFA